MQLIFSVKRVLGHLELWAPPFFEQGSTKGNNVRRAEKVADSNKIYNQGFIQTDK